VETKWNDKYLYTKAEWKKRVKRDFVKYVYEDEFFDIVVPLHEDAAYELSGPPITQWCTSTKIDSYFNKYASKEYPLYMIRDKRQIVTLGKGSGEPRPLYQVHFDGCLWCDWEDSHFDFASFLKQNEKMKMFFKPMFMKKLKTAVFSTKYFFATITELYEDKAIELRLFRLLKRHISKSEVSIVDTQSMRVIFKKFGYHRVLDYIFSKLDENIRQLRIEMRHYNDVGYCLPERIGKYKNLEILDLEGFVKKIPASIGELKKLSVLSLRRNKVKTIPEEIKNIKSLVIMDLRFNEISPELLQTTKNVYVKHGKSN
jgi:hypothetical protein